MDLSKYLKQGRLTKAGVGEFQSLIHAYYRENKRSFAWRVTSNPYYIVASEIMLQQTQTERVKSKYEEFITRFPTLYSLANSPLSDVIKAWQGLGYNRRAIALHLFAQRVAEEYQGVVPQEPAILKTFKGIGYATASSICAFAFNKPTIFIETNIRAVFIHTFFRDQKEIKDVALLPLVEQTVDKENPREWYYALMDYGVMLKKNFKNPSRKSAHHTVQSKFEGSDRQVRGLILKMLVATPKLQEDSFLESIPREPEKIRRILAEVLDDGFICKSGDYYMLAKSSK